MIKEYDHVKVIKTGDAGIVVDIRDTGGIFYLVELDKNNELLDCKREEIEKLGNQNMARIESTVQNCMVLFLCPNLPTR